MHTLRNIEIAQVICRNIYIHIHTNRRITTFFLKEAINLKESKERYVRSFEEKFGNTEKK